MRFTHAILSTLVSVTTLVQGLPAAPTADAANGNPICNLGGVVATALTSLLHDPGVADPFCTSALNIHTSTYTSLYPHTSTVTVISYKDTTTFRHPTKTLTDIKHVTTCLPTTHHAAAEARGILPSILPLPTPSILSGLLDQQITAVCRCLDLPTPTVTVRRPSAQHSIVKITKYYTKTHVDGKATTTTTVTSTGTINHCPHHN